MTLCTPCAKRMEDGYTVKKIPGATRKDTCTECGKRRFCLDWQVEKK